MPTNCYCRLDAAIFYSTLTRAWRSNARSYVQTVENSCLVKRFVHNWRVKWIQLSHRLFLFLSLWWVVSWLSSDYFRAQQATVFFKRALLERLDFGRAKLPLWAGSNRKGHQPISATPQVCLLPVSQGSQGNTKWASSTTPTFWLFNSTCQ